MNYITKWKKFNYKSYRDGMLKGQKNNNEKANMKQKRQLIKMRAGARMLESGYEWANHCERSLPQPFRKRRARSLEECPKCFCQPSRRLKQERMLTHYGDNYYAPSIENKSMHEQECVLVRKRESEFSTTAKWVEKTSQQRSKIHE